jgi:hypothetical protein
MTGRSATPPAAALPAATPPAAALPAAALPGLAGAGLLGLVLAAGVGVVAALRRDRPMHAVGQTHHAVLHRTAGGEPSGVPWLDEPGEQAGLVRFSRGAGLPAWAPDVHGLALRLHEPHGHSDLLLASAGLRGAGRFVLVPRRSPFDGPVTTLMPYRTPRGPVLLAAEPADPSPSPGTGRHARRGDARHVLTGSHWVLQWSGLTGPWHPFGMLSVGADAGPVVDRTTRFEPVRATPPGLPSYRWAALLRRPAYRTARVLGRPRRGSTHAAPVTPPARRTPRRRPA